MAEQPDAHKTPPPLPPSAGRNRHCFQEPDYKGTSRQMGHREVTHYVPMRSKTHCAPGRPLEMLSAPGGPPVDARDESPLKLGMLHRNHTGSAVKWQLYWNPATQPTRVSLRGVPLSLAPAQSPRTPTFSSGGCSVERAHHKQSGRPEGRRSDPLTTGQSDHFLLGPR